MERSSLADGLRGDGGGRVIGNDLPLNWLVGNGRMVVIVVIILPLPPFPTNQR